VFEGSSRGPTALNNRDSIMMGLLGHLGLMLGGRMGLLGLVGRVAGKGSRPCPVGLCGLS
jgi:hypothetical protein